MKTIITIQHTESVHHTNGMVGSWTDWSLTERGKLQAENIGKRLAESQTGKDFVMYSSDLLRARQTAEIVGRHMKLTPILTPALRERNLGRCVGQSMEWMQQNREMREVTVDDRMFSDGESRRDEWNRLAPFFEKLLSDEHENIIVVSHGDLLGVLNVMWLGLGVEALNSIEIAGSAGGVGLLIENEDRKRTIKRVGDMSYAKGIEA